MTGSGNRDEDPGEADGEHATVEEVAAESADTCFRFRPARCGVGVELSAPRDWRNPATLCY